ncbi:Succinate dehydrogenase cytochrome b560 subunit, mitochondrial [Gryllus bimaculatus]|nr:Succinate dehydrogenase cytochrome b560 subunit, mitochondrial [Gryllus bimaculatus]
MALFIGSLKTVSIKAAPAPPPSTETFDEKNARLKRPQSPHLTIYKPQLTSMLSITHRMTGMALCGYMTVLGLGSLTPFVDFPFLAESIANLHLPGAVLYSGKAMIAFPAAYHFINGIRHLLWDTGRFLTIKHVYTTGYITLGISLLFTAWLVTL